MSGSPGLLVGAPVTDLDDFVCRGGGQGLSDARQTTPDALIALVEKSGLRGRGGAGFPTGRKLRTVAAAFASSDLPVGKRHVVVNAAEGEPGTFKDRAIIRHNPYLVLEGACIAARAVGASDVIVATKRSFAHEIDRLDRAIRELADAGITDGFHLQVVVGPAEYLFGEETAMLEVLDGRPPFPRVTAPYRRGIAEPKVGTGAAAPVDGPAVLVSNVETFANLAGIVRHGAEWFRDSGTGQSPGTIVCTVTGDTVRDGVGEFPLGTTLRSVIDSIGGGVPDGRRILAVLNGVSTPPLGPDDLDTPLTHEDMAAVGSGLGSASFIVVDDTRSLRSVAAAVSRFLAIESCGQCEHCKGDGLVIADALHRTVGVTETEFDSVAEIEALVADRLASVTRGARCALAGQQERVVGRLLEMASATDTSQTSRAVEQETFPIAPLVDIVSGRARLDLAHSDKRADWTYAGEEPDSHAWPAERLIDHPVHIGPVHTRESDVTSDGSRPAPLDLATRDAFEALHGIDDRLEREIETLREASPTDRSSALLDLRRALERHQRVTERLVYPLVRALDPEDGDDIVWYPQNHEQHAARLLRRLDLGNLAISPQLVDELCADVHASIIELQRKVLPMLERNLMSDDPERRRVEAAVGDLAAPV